MTTTQPAVQFWWAFGVGPLGGGLVGSAAMIFGLGSFPGSDSTDSGFVFAMLLPGAFIGGVVIGSACIVLSVGAAYLVGRRIPRPKMWWAATGAATHGCLTLTAGLVIRAWAFPPASPIGPIVGGALAAAVIAPFLAFASEKRPPRPARNSAASPWMPAGAEGGVSAPGTPATRIELPLPRRTVSGWIRRREDERRARRHGGVTGR